MAVLVGEAFSRLDLTAQRVMQALAIYRYPVPPAAVDYLLQPYVPGIDSGRVLSRLVNMQFVRRDAGRYYLHQVDRDYALSRIAEGDPADREREAPPSLASPYDIGRPSGSSCLANPAKRGKRSPISRHNSPSSSCAARARTTTQRRQCCSNSISTICSCGAITD